MSNLVVIRERVSDRLATSGNDVVDAVIAEMVKAEMGDRVQLVIRAVSKRDEMQLNLDKIKPDAPNVDADGKPVGAASFSPQKFAERKKLQELISKLDAAVSKAIDGDYEQLKKLMAEQPTQ